jgi:gamma-glutamyl-gamma-aminobutyrate hydrolase PuuD
MMKKIEIVITCLAAMLWIGSAASAQTPLKPNMQEVEQEINALDAHQQATSAPLIGISAAHSTKRDSGARQTYVNAIIRAGGIPVILPLTANGEVLRQMLSHLDALVMTGGGDICPSYYNETPAALLDEVDSLRDRYDLLLIRMAVQRHLPLLGICRGEQLINVAFGGTLYQDLPSQHPSAVCHSQHESSAIATHPVTISSGSLLRSLIGKDTLYVNSFHHQAVRQVASGFKATAYAPDSVVEAIESTTAAPVWAVQFHPEGLILSGDDTALSIFRYLVLRANVYRETKSAVVRKSTSTSPAVRRSSRR